MQRCVIKQAAIEAGAKQYTSPTPCKHGHGFERLTKNGGCVVCEQTMRKRYLAERLTPEQQQSIKERGRRHYQANRETYIARARERQDRLLVRKPPRVKQKQHGYWTAQMAKYRASKKQAIPPWADLDAIARVYANCPIGMEVDHIYPLQSDWCCGLHVVENLQYLTRSENASKSNRRVE